MLQEGQGTLPLEGSIPDMTATTELYLKLQRIYREKADRDIALVEQHVQEILQRIGRPADSISHDAIRHFCKNARNLRVVTYRPLQVRRHVSRWRFSLIAKTCLHYCSCHARASTMFC